MSMMYIQTVEAELRKFRCVLTEANCCKTMFHASTQSLHTDACKGFTLTSPAAGTHNLTVRNTL